MQQQTVTLIVGGLGILGTLGGVVVGQYMARTWERRQWLLEKKIDEYRELLTTITEAYAYFILNHRSGVAQSPEIQQHLNDLNSQSLQVIRTRILVAKEIREKDVMNLWADALRKYDDSFEVDPFTWEYHKVCNIIVKLALDESEKRTT